jgi:hypothetical protein
MPGAAKPVSKTGYKIALYCIGGLYTCDAGYFLLNKDHIRMSEQLKFWLSYWAIMRLLVGISLLTGIALFITRPILLLGILGGAVISILLLSDQSGGEAGATMLIATAIAGAALWLSYKVHD